MDNAQLNLKSAIALVALAFPVVACSGDNRNSNEHTCPYYGGVPVPSGADASPTECAALCEPEVPSGYTLTSCTFGETDAGLEATFVASGSCSAGRLPPGWRRQMASVSHGAIGKFFADVARLESAAVAAFAHLSRELSAHEAPRWIQQATAMAAVEEVGHARAVSGLANHFGVYAVARVDARFQGIRSLDAIAIENAAEGCVRETYGAVIAHWQAAHAGCRRVAETMRRIAREETAHAELSWSLARWANRRLDRTGRMNVRDALFGALADLRKDVDMASPPDVVSLGGIPPRSVAVALLDRLARDVILPQGTLTASEVA